MSASIKVNVAGLQRVHRALNKSGRKAKYGMTQLMNLIGDDLVESTQKRFERQTSPDNRFWTPLSAATRKARRQPNPRILRNRGLLYQSLTHRSTSNTLQVGTNNIYAGIHQFGGKTGVGHKVSIPARPFLGLSSADSAKIGRRCDSFLRKVSPA